MSKLPLVVKLVPPSVTPSSVPLLLVSVLPMMVPFLMVPLSVPKPPAPNCPVPLMSNAVALFCRSNVPVLAMLTVPPLPLNVPKLSLVKLPPRFSVPPERAIVLPALFQVAVLLPPRLKVPLETLTAAPAVLVKLPYV